MDYILMIITIIIVFPLVFLAAVKVKQQIPPKKRILLALISAAVLVNIFVIIPLVTNLTFLFSPVGHGFLYASVIGILLGLTGPIRFKRR